MKNRKEQFRMETESLSKNEEFVRVVVTVFISRMNPTLEELDDVKTVMSEAVTNTVVHDYQGKDGIIYIEASVKGDELTIIVRDRGVGIWDVKQVMESMFTSDATKERSGMGFSLMGAFMDEVRVESTPDEEMTATTEKRIDG